MTVYLERGYNHKEHPVVTKTALHIFQRRFFMIYVGIDVAKDKHDCFITNFDGEVLFKAFTIANNLDGFNDLYQKYCIRYGRYNQSKSRTGSHRTL